MPDNDEHHPYTVNLGLYTTSTELTGYAEADTWYNTAEGRVKTQLAAGKIGITGPQGGHPLIYDAANAWYNLQPDATAQNGIITTQNRAYARPLYPGRKCTLKGIAMETVSGGGAGNRPILAALYDSDATTGLPGALVASYGTTNATAVGAVISGWTVDTDLQPYPYWLVVVTQSALATEFITFHGTSTMVPQLVATPTMTASDYLNNSLYTDTGFSGAAPATFGTPVTSTYGPGVYVNLVP